MAGVKILRFLPHSLADNLVDPHAGTQETEQDEPAVQGEQASA